MDLVLVVLLLVAVGAVVAVALGRLRGGLAPVGDELPPPLEKPLRRTDDLDEARFGVGLRGYRMDQVDAVLDEAKALLQAKDAEIARLRTGTDRQARPVEPWTATSSGADVATDGDAPVTSSDAAVTAGPGDHA